MATFEEVRERAISLQLNVKEHERGFYCFCPVHGDTKSRHLSVSPGRKQEVVFHCFHGCGFKEIAAAFGLGPGDASGRDPTQRDGDLITHDYRDSEGRLLSQTCRLGSGPGKRIWQRRPGPLPGEWIDDLQGVPRVLYRLPELLAADPGAIVLLGEGEKVADALARTGNPATTNAMGAKHWRDEFAEVLRGRRVGVFRDYDPDGEAWAAAVCESLARREIRHAVVELPGLGRRENHGADAYDWLRQGHQPRELLELAEAALAGDPGAGGIASRLAPSDLRPLIGALVERFGHEPVNREVLLSSLGPDTPDPFARGVIRASELPPPEDPPRLWFGLYRGSVTLLIGETGAGKSSLLYNIALHAARNEPLYGIPFGLGRPLRVLYVDPENAGNWEEGHGGICALRLDRIDQGRPRDLVFHDGRGVNLADPLHVAALGHYLQREAIDLCIVDPIANLFATEDENDNAEGTRQIKALTLLGRRTGAAMVPCHHTGKDTSGIYGRGASSRLGAADAGMVLRVRNGGDEQDDEYHEEPRERDDLCRLQVAKNRWEGNGSLFLRMAGNDRFERVSFDEWRTARSSSGPQSKAGRCAEELLLVLLDGTERSRAELVAAMQAEGFGRGCIDEALAALVQIGAVQRRPGERGQALYRRPLPEEGSLLPPQ